MSLKKPDGSFPEEPLEIERCIIPRQEDWLKAVQICNEERIGWAKDTFQLFQTAVVDAIISAFQHQNKHYGKELPSRGRHVTPNLEPGSRVKLNTEKKCLEKVQQVTGAIKRSCPTAGMKILLGIMPLHLFIESCAEKTILWQRRIGFGENIRSDKPTHHF